MIEIFKFIGRNFLTTLAMMTVFVAVLAILSYIFDGPVMIDSKKALISGNVADALYELIRMAQVFVLVVVASSIVETILLGLIESIAIVWRGRGFKPEYFNRTQTTTVKSTLDYTKLFDLCEDAAVALKGKVIRADIQKGIIEAETKSKLTGLSEKITIAVRKDSTYLISSKTTSGFASLYGVTNLGRNVKNVRLIVEHTHHHSNSHEVDVSELRKGNVKLVMAMLSIGLASLVVAIGTVVVAVVASDSLPAARQPIEDSSVVYEERTAEELVRESVVAFKENNSLPLEISEGIVITDVTEESKAIRVHLVISHQASEDLSPEFLKSNFVSNACQTKMDMEFLDYINMEYAYIIKETGQKHLITLTKSDCQPVLDEA